MIVASLSDVGRKRRHNEDALLASDFVLAAGARRVMVHLLVLSDGMGGAAAGEVASSLTIETVSCEIYRQLVCTHLNRDRSYVNLPKIVEEAIRRANERVFSTARASHLYAGMGATCTAVVACQGRIVVGHVGDSRCYLWRGGELGRITRDHSFVDQLLRGGRITQEEAERHPRRNVITRAIGSREEVKVDVMEEEVHGRDTLLVCSDGLHGMIGDEGIRALLAERCVESQTPETLGGLCRSLVSAGQPGGGGRTTSRWGSCTSRRRTFPGGAAISSTWTKASSPGTRRRCRGSAMRVSTILDGGGREGTVEGKLIDLEIHVGHLEATVMDLDEAMRGQAAVIAAMEKKLRRMESRLRALEGAPPEAEGEAEEPPPPHY